MADMASATLSVGPEHVDATLKILQKFEYVTKDGEWVFHGEGELNIDHTGLVMEIYEARWGSSELIEGYGDEFSVTDVLRAAKIPFTIIDGGHYTWDPIAITWRPPETDLTYRSATMDGEIMLPASKYKEVMDRVQGDTTLMVRWIDNYFSDFPEVGFLES